MLLRFNAKTKKRVKVVEWVTSKTSNYVPTSISPGVTVLCYTFLTKEIKNVSLAKKKWRTYRTVNESTISKEHLNILHMRNCSTPRFDIRSLVRPFRETSWHFMQSICVSFPEGERSEHNYNNFITTVENDWEVARGLQGARDSKASLHPSCQRKRHNR